MRRGFSPDSPKFRLHDTRPTKRMSVHFWVYKFTFRCVSSEALTRYDHSYKRDARCSLRTNSFNGPNGYEAMPMVSKGVAVNYAEISTYGR